MSKRKKNSKAWSEQEARRVLSEQGKSGESVAAFAKRRGLVAERLYWWRRQLEGPAKGARRRARAASGEMRFGEVAAVVQERRAQPEANGARLEVVLASGRRISVPAGFDAQEMQRLVAVLEAA